MILRRFQSRIVALLIAVVASAQLATLAVVQVATERSVAAQLQRDLAVGQRVWQRFFESRGSQLIESSAVLADDFGFKAAVASGDPETMRSALDNHGSRIGAGAAVLLSPDGGWLSGSSAMSSAEKAEVLRPLLDEALAQGSAMSLLVIEGELHLMVLLPVLAPHPLAWVGIGVRFDDVQARDFHGLTGLQVSFVRSHDSSNELFGSSLDSGLRRALAGHPPLQRDEAHALTLDDAHFLAQQTPLLAVGADSIDLMLLASLDQAMEPFAELRQRILLLAGVASVIALGIAVLLGRGISRPVSGLAAAVRRVQGGDYSKPVVVRGHDEIAQLAADFSEMQQGIAAREARIVHQASHDGLTGLPNRSLALRRLQQSLSRSMPEGQCVVVALLDVERFKEINDKFGHRFGDEVLLELSRRLQQAVRADDTVARLGADEFMVVLVGVERAQVLRRAEALLSQLRSPLELSVAQVGLGAGIGISLAPEHGDDAETLLRRADIALYEAKQKQQGIALYQPGRDEQHLRQLTLMSDLRLSIERGELSLRFQPKVEVASRRVVHVESLLRWTHGELGPVGPDEFIPLAERSGFVHELTRFVLDSALAENRRWRDEGLDLGVAVNLSALDLMDAELPLFIEHCLKRHRVPAERLILEVTESALMRDVEFAIRTLQRLRAGGIRLSIDDFGTGYSSLAQLKRLPVDELKIDKSFVLQLVEGSDDAVIVRSTIDLGHNMGLKVIAEGVENRGGLDLLARYGCDLVQGYFFSPPVEGRRLQAWCSTYVAAQAREEGP